MNLQQLINAVYVETNRPDLDTQTMQAILAATLELHGMDLFPKDVETARVVFDAPYYIQQIDTSSLPRFRRLFYARKNSPNLAPYQQNPQLLPPVLDPATGGVNFSQSMAFLRVLDPNDILDDYGTEKLDVCYLAGSTIWIKSSTALQYAFLGWYQYPSLDTSDPSADKSYPNFKSWIAVERPYAIVYKAASKIFTRNGKQDVSRMYDRTQNPQIPGDQGGLVQTEILQLLADNILLGDN